MKTNQVMLQSFRQTFSAAGCRKGKEVSPDLLKLVENLYHIVLDMESKHNDNANNGILVNALNEAMREYITDADKLIDSFINSWGE